MAQRHTDALTELAELGLALARDVQARALAAPDEQVPDLTLAFHRLSRSVRQTLALESRLERERRAVAREVSADAKRDLIARVQKKRAQVRKAISPLIWTEAEGDEDEAEALFEALDTALMDGELFEPAFADAPLEACVARIAADLGLAAANTDMAAEVARDAAGDVAANPGEFLPGVVPRESSA